MDFQTNMEPAIRLPSSLATSLGRGHSRSPSRSPTRSRFTDELLGNLSPATTLEALNSVNASGALKASIEAASPVQRAFGIRAAVASKCINDWVCEIQSWPWPAGGGSQGFACPDVKEAGFCGQSLGGVSQDESDRDTRTEAEKETHWGSLPVTDVLKYDARLDVIASEMEELHVEELKSRVLETHLSSRSSPPSASGLRITSGSPSSGVSYNRIDDFTAIVTATVLQALPKLAKLYQLMNTWTTRITILRETPSLLALMAEVEIALKSSRELLDISAASQTNVSSAPNKQSIRETFAQLHRSLQIKVTKLGKRLDSMLDSLAGRPDTLPEAWLDRMEAIETDYGEWVVERDRMIAEAELRVSIAQRVQNMPEGKVIDLVSAMSMENHETMFVSARSVAGLKVDEDSPEEEADKARSMAESNSKERDTSVREPHADGEVRPTDNLQLSDGCSDSRGISSTGREFGALSAQPETANEEDLIEIVGNSQDSTQPGHDLSTSCMPTSSRADVLATMAKVSPKSHHYDNKDDEDFIGAESNLSGEPVHSSHLLDMSAPASLPFPEPTSNITDSSAVAQVSERALGYYPPPTSAATDEPTIAENAELSLTRATEQIYGGIAVEETVNTPSTELHILAKPDLEPSNRQASSQVRLSPRTIPRFGSGFANSLRRSSPALRTPAGPLDDPFRDDPLVSHKRGTTTTADQNRNVLGGEIVGANTRTDSANLMILNNDLNLVECGRTLEEAQREFDRNNSSSRIVSFASSISGYASSDPSPQILKAEPAEYFKPVLSPIRSTAADSPMPSPAKDMSCKYLDSPTLPTSPYIPQTLSSSRSPIGLDHQTEAIETTMFMVDSPTLPQFAQLHIQSGNNGLNLQDNGLVPGHVDSRSAPTFATIGNEAADCTSELHDFDFREKNPITVSQGIVRDQTSNLTSTESPLARCHRITCLPEDNAFLSPVPGLDSVVEEAPLLSNVPVTSGANMTSPINGSDTQLQQQISEILSSLPAARITLASSINTSPVQVKKRNYAHSTGYRSLMSPRAATPTPSFTLAPAPISARAPRQRSTPSKPETKLYHLSRSTGEAPVKLLVRLVGEHGERVMVRVGGGWADLGEYLREYATHHGGRASDASAGRVEIQDLPRRNISGSSISAAYPGMTYSRPAERSSPISRPDSSLALGRHEAGALNIRKTRRDSPTGTAFNTPPSKAFATLGMETSSPPSAQSRSSSAMSWRSDNNSRGGPSGRHEPFVQTEGELGLAGPRIRKAEMSKEKMDWVENMKEKVRVASAEKERKGKLEEFGRLGKVGATKRLFRRSGSGRDSAAGDHTGL